MANGIVGQGKVRYFGTRRNGKFLIVIFIGFLIVKFKDHYHDSEYHFLHIVLQNLTLLA